MSTALAKAESALAMEMDPFADQTKDLTDDHLKLLYMVSKYASAAEHRGDSETWIRQTHLNVLIYEGVKAGVFDYDYAPASTLVGSTRVWMNTSQEGKDDIDDLREQGYINGLKLSTDDLQPVTAFQCSLSGIKLLKNLAVSLSDNVDIFCTPPRPFPPELKLVKWEPEHRKFSIYTPKGYHVYTAVTEAEEVSYVMSPFLVPCFLRERDIKFTDNGERAFEAARGINTIADANLSEAMVMENVCVLISEWVPFGSNQIVALNEKMGSAERCQGGLLTGKLDHDPGAHGFECDTGMTTVRILDYHPTAHVNLEAEIQYPEDDGIVQVETFGIHFSKEGTLVYGMRLESIGARLKDDISVDMLCRVLADVHEDSSVIVDSLLSLYQRKLLQMTYNGDQMQRPKFNVVLAQRVRPRLRSHQYLDGEAIQCEITQVIGDIDEAHDIGPHDVLLIGRHGVLLAGDNAITHDIVISALLTLLALDMFLQCFFQRTFVLADVLFKLREAIGVHTSDPSSIPRIRATLSSAASDVVLLTEVLGYLDESVSAMENPPFPKDVQGIELYGLLGVEGRLVNLKERVRDLFKNVRGCESELANLTQMTDVINATKLEEVFGHVEVNTKELVTRAGAQEKSSHTLRVIQMLLAATMGFDLVDRFTGLDLAAPPELAAWQQSVVETFVWQPGVWFLLNLGAALVVCQLVLYMMLRLEKRAVGLLKATVVVNIPIDMERLWAYTDTKPVSAMDSTKDTGDFAGQRKKIKWTEVDPAAWDGGLPEVTLLVQEPEEVSSDDEEDLVPDASSNPDSFLLEIEFAVDSKTTTWREKELKRKLMDELDRAGVLIRPSRAARGKGSGGFKNLAKVSAL